MLDPRPIIYFLGLVSAVLGSTMLFPMLIDLVDGSDNWQSFLEAALISIVLGGGAALATANSPRERLSIQQIFLLTVLAWVVLPLFGALPFMLGATQNSLSDAMFEAVSCITTTGSTVLSGLDSLPRGILFWRGMMQWFGGIGIIIVAMAFLPEMRIGGMQVFRSEGFDTQGKILPHATEIASRISVAYFGLTVLCALSYLAIGLTPFDAVTLAFTTLSTGGMANSDSSFAELPPMMEYAASLFMILAALPFARYVQLLAGSARPLWQDSQVRAFMATTLALVVAVTLWQWTFSPDPPEAAFRHALFNAVSVLSGTGYASQDYTTWGAFPVAAFFFMGLVGGCTGSTACSVKIFRYQILFSAIRAQIRRIHDPHGIFPVRYAGRRVSEDAVFSVMVFFVLFVITLGVFSVLLAMCGLDFITSISGAATAVANIGPGFGPIIGPAGNFEPLGDLPKWLLIAAMIIGRLELVTVYVIFTRRFWSS